MKSTATITNTIAPTNVGVSRKFQAGAVNITMTGLEPAGGCTVLVICINAIAVPAASATLHQCAPNRVRNIRPTSDDRK